MGLFSFIKSTSFRAQKPIQTLSEAPKQEQKHVVGMPQGRMYQSSIIDRLNNGQFLSQASADVEIKFSLAISRARAREMERNDDYFRMFLREMESNVVGKDGFHLQNQAINALGKPDKRLNNWVQDHWEKWCSMKNCTVSKTYTFKQVCRLVVRSVARDGDVLVRRIRGFKNDYNYAIQVLENDYLDHMYSDYRTLANGNRIVMGVELNSWREPVAFWLTAEHPGDYDWATVNETVRIRVPADECLLVMIRERPGQTRGFCWAASSMRRMNMLHGYEEAEIVAARAAAQKMGFIENDYPESYQGEIDKSGNIIQNSEAGSIEQLPMGSKFKEWNPDHPNGNYVEFRKGVLRGIASGLGMAYNRLGNDLEGVNYSSIRSGALSERDVYMILQETFLDEFVLKIFDDFISMLFLSPIPKPQGATIEKANCPKFHGRRWGWVDPLKDIQATGLAIENKLTTKSRALGMLGENYFETMDELAVEQEYEEELGLPPSPAQHTVLLQDKHEDNPKNIDTAPTSNGSAKKPKSRSKKPVKHETEQDV